VLAVPQGIGGHWNDGRPDAPPARLEEVDDVGFLAALIDHVASGGPIDLARVYVTGLSNWASMSGRLACELVPRIANVSARRAGAREEGGRNDQDLGPDP
jgi:polyhydroxybutyrate depolymerase